MTHPERYYHVSHTQLSPARITGGITVNGTAYHYDPATDTLIRADIWSAELKASKAAQQEYARQEREKRKALAKNQTELGF